MNAGGILIGEGLRADGVLIDAPPPLGRLWFPLTSGLTVLYGRNGVGKTKLLNALNAAMTGVALEDGDVSLHVSTAADFGSFAQAPLLQLLAAMRRASGDETESLADHAFSSMELMSWAEQEEAWTSLKPEAEFIDRVRQALDGLLARAKVHSPRVALVARGTTIEPAWDLYVSAVPTDAAEFGTDFAQVDEIQMPCWYRIVIRSARSSSAGVPVLVLPVLLKNGPPSNPVASLESSRPVACLRADDESDLDRQTLERLLASAPSSDGVRVLIESSELDGMTLDDDVEELVRVFEGAATGVYQELTPNGGRLRLEFRLPNEWLVGSTPVYWTAEDEFGTRLPIGSLGSGWARWARLAVSLALSSSSVQFDHPVVLLVDEPERALHPAAQHHVAKAFSEMSDTIEFANSMVHATIVASHSPAFLAQTGSRLVHVSRAGKAQVALEEIDATQDVTSLTASLGVTQSDVLQLIRWFVFVEGDHDVAIIESLYGAQLRQRHARLLSMRGASKAEAHITSEFLLSYSDARIRVVLDRIGQSTAKDWLAARDSFSRSDPNDAKRHLERIGRRADRESQWLFEAGMAAMDRGVLDRVDVVGLQEFDIIAYLPVHLVVPGATSWKELSKEWRAAGQKPAFKDWLRAAKGARISAKRLTDLSVFIEDRRDLDAVIAGL